MYTKPHKKSWGSGKSALAIIDAYSRKSANLLIRVRSTYMVKNWIKPMKSTCLPHFIIYVNIITK